MKIGFYYNCYKNKNATDNILRITRNYYPDNPIYLLSDKGDDFTDIAKKYNCKYKYSQVNILGGRKINNKHFMCFSSFEHCKIYMSEVSNAIKYCNTEYLVFLEDDVLIKGNIKKFPEFAGGNIQKNNFNLLLSKEGIKKIKENYNIKFFFWSIAGGSIIKTKILEDCFKISDEELKLFDKYCIHENHELWHTNDVLLSYLLMIKGYTVEAWTNTDKSNIIHPFKKFY